ncbi:MAG: hypothetical protein E6G97_09270 [Alphaproteobacteria bacterium]|nr:MAG: hypothetical protein E6G97_09270 [Alphaproteobacteria bacterium]
MQMSQWLERPFTADTLALLSSAPLDQKTHPAVAELQAALGREAALRREMGELAQRQVMLAQEFEHRLVNGLQVISSLLSLQSQEGEDFRGSRSIGRCGRPRCGARARASHAASARSSGSGGVQALSRASLRGSLTPVVRGIKRLRRAGRGRECRNSDGVRHPARLHRQRADHQCGEIRQGQHHRPV